MLSPGGRRCSCATARSPRQSRDEGRRPPELDSWDEAALIFPPREQLPPLLLEMPPAEDRKARLWFCLMEARCEEAAKKAHAEPKMEMGRHGGDNIPLLRYLSRP